MPRRVPRDVPSPSSAPPSTVLEGATTHNLRDVSLDLHAGEVVAVTGVSGAGKSSLALDTLYAEGQRRFVESFSPYARQFLERLERPPTRRLEPVPAAVAVDRRAPVKTSRSTVATLADLEPYLAALFVRESVPWCPEHEQPATTLDAIGAAQRIASRAGASRVVVSYPLRVDDREHYLVIRDALAARGVRRLWIGGQARDLDAVPPSEALGAVEVVVDRTSAGERDRLAEAVDRGWAEGAGVVHAHFSDRAPLALRRGLACGVCARALPEPRAGLFSYDSPLGACGTCRGFGRVIGIDLHKVIPDPERSLARRAIRPWSGASSQWERAELGKLCKRHGIPMDVPWRALGDDQRARVIDGDGSWDSGAFPGVRGWFRWLETRTYKMHVRVLLSRYRSYDPCPTCGGRRLGPDALTFRVDGASLADWHALSVEDARTRVAELTCTTAQGELARRELLTRLDYLDRVGLGYLALDRASRTLSGGEAQRVTLTSALGTSLHNALFVLDEPSVGLHAEDVRALTGLIHELAARSNTVLVVEHDPALIRGADRVIEVGPGAGEAGGRVEYDGTPVEVARKGGATARALAGASIAASRAVSSGPALVLRGARAHNLRDVSASFPLGAITAVVGPSGSGKSSLVARTLYPAVARALRQLDVDLPGEHDGLDGVASLRAVTLVDQSPLGRTSRGNAATYTKAWDALRKRLAGEPEALARGLGPGAFSFNVAGGRCEACAGEGFETVEMQFLADVRLSCPVCRGRRFKPDVLAVRHRGLGAADLLAATIASVVELFADDAAIRRALAPAVALGLDYLRLGQPLSTLSGGEAQRLKLARALSERNQAGLFVLDEPSAGLHVDEVGKLMLALRTLVKGGATVVLVDHDLDVIRAADHVIELGPGGGRHGGQLVASAPPAQLADLDTATGRALRAARAPIDAASEGERPPAAPRELVVRSAREHNLRDVSVRIPHGALTVVTGPSGSGKSTLTFDVVFAEGQRRFLETLTPYARQFLPTLPRPDVESVTGVPPSIALEQRTSRAGARSTVATVTEIAHYLRLLFAKVGVPHCPDHGAPLAARSPADLLLELHDERGPRELLAPAVRARKGTYLDLFTAAARAGVARARCDGVVVVTDDPPRLAKVREHDIDLIVATGIEPRAIDLPLLERALHWGEGAVKLRDARGREQIWAATSACPACGLSVPELDPRYFSFATAQGRCEACAGEGVVVRTTVRGRGKSRTATETTHPCPACAGTRLAPIPRAVRVQGATYAEVSALDVRSALDRVAAWRFVDRAKIVAQPLVTELNRRLQFSADVGLGYLALDRRASTLSGGELQRLRLAAQLGAGLSGALYVLDEPTIGLHPRDTSRLLDNLRRLVSLGSTIVVVEHDADTILAADHLIDLGPAGGSRGGRVIAEGAPRDVLKHPESPTAVALGAPAPLRSALAVPAHHPRLVLSGVRHHNLRGLDVRVPLGRLVAVVGVSGSGKSTLVGQVLLPAVRAALGLTGDVPGVFDSLTGLDGIERALAVDQAPIGRTPRSVPATFLGIWDDFRRLFAGTVEARALGMGAARFSFNTPSGGRCTHCEGQGVITHEMSFMPDVVTPCAVCAGQRFEPRTLTPRYLGLTIGEVLQLTAEEAASRFAVHPRIARPLEVLRDLGAGYVTLGQGSHTLSGGEAQRLKLAAELAAGERHAPTLYVLDEPTTGLHLADVDRLVGVLDRLVARGDSVVVIEHHPRVIAGADHVIELGPEGGARGGRIVAEGRPAAVAKKATPTAVVLRAVLDATSAA